MKVFTILMISFLNTLLIKAQDTVLKDCTCFSKDRNAWFEFMLLKPDSTFMITAMGGGVSRISGTWSKSADTLNLRILKKQFSRNRSGQEFEFYVYDKYVFVSKGKLQYYHQLESRKSRWRKVKGAVFIKSVCDTSNYLFPIPD